MPIKLHESEREREKSLQYRLVVKIKMYPSNDPSTNSAITQELTALKTSMALDLAL